MRTPPFWTLPLVLLLACAGGRSQDLPADPPGVAVVELFGSEGCSSCPPADELLAEWAERADREQLPVFVLSYHVPYWDRLGWPDRFARLSWEQRQRAYSARLGDRVYTPQAVVNGRYSFTGSRQAELSEHVAEELERPVAFTLAGTAKSTAIGLQVEVQVNEVRKQAWPEGAVLQVALVEDGLSSRVTAGENRGRELHHVAVVRELRTVPLRPGELMYTVVLPLEAVDDPSRMRVVAFVQEAADGPVLGAAALPVTP